MSLEKILNESYDLNEKTINKSELTATDFYVVAYWQKFFGGKKGYQESVVWMEEEIKKNNSQYTFTFIKINADLQEKWGLVAGKKAKLKLKQKNNTIKMEITKLPIKK
ncbi:MAG: hypothetical protein EAZ85_16135 [Bacteroidetes bacterium]|nr:MAG: hypothetical protein EAZ85_16135 [Bacteroidota bacterium]TAG85235.1 MAG: hypothetical protein EAZ20_15745 [Bacteroidota bacterium]